MLRNNGKGINDNFANALAHCRGDYIAFSDQDDAWHKDKLALLANRICDSSLLVYGRSQLMGNGLLTFCPHVPQMEKLFDDNSLVYFDNTEDLVEKATYFHESNDECEQ